MPQRAEIVREGFVDVEADAWWFMAGTGGIVTLVAFEQRLLARVLGGVRDLRATSRVFRYTILWLLLLPVCALVAILINPLDSIGITLVLWLGLACVSVYALARSAVRLWLVGSWAHLEDVSHGRDSSGEVVIPRVGASHKESTAHEACLRNCRGCGYEVDRDVSCPECGEPSERITLGPGRFSPDLVGRDMATLLWTGAIQVFTPLGLLLFLGMVAIGLDLSELITRSILILAFGVPSLALLFCLQTLRNSATIGVWPHVAVGTAAFIACIACLDVARLYLSDRNLNSWFMPEIHAALGFATIGWVAMSALPLLLATEQQRIAQKLGIKRDRQRARTILAMSVSVRGVLCGVARPAEHHRRHPRLRGVSTAA